MNEAKVMEAAERVKGKRPFLEGECLDADCRTLADAYLTLAERTTELERLEALWRKWKEAKANIHQDGVWDSGPVDDARRAFAELEAWEAAKLPAADGEEPVTEEWLRSVGFISHGKNDLRMAQRPADEMGIHLCFDPTENRCWLQEVWLRNLGLSGFRSHEISNVNLPWPKTRNGVLSLCTALSIKLKDGEGCK